MPLAVWDSGVDTSLFKAQRVMDAAGQPLVIGFDFGLTPVAIICQVLPNGQLRALRELQLWNAAAQQLGERLQSMIRNTYGQPNALRCWGDPAGDAGAQKARQWHARNLDRVLEPQEQPGGSAFMRGEFENVKKRGLEDQVKTWDGCFNIRKKRGASSSSLHSWGLAIDINAAWNGFGKKPTMSPELVACFTDAGMDWGGTWSTPDGMHFQARAL